MFHFLLLLCLLVKLTDLRPVTESQCLGLIWMACGKIRGRPSRSGAARDGACQAKADDNRRHAGILGRTSASCPARNRPAVFFCFPVHNSFLLSEDKNGRRERRPRYSKTGVGKDLSSNYARSVQRGSINRLSGQVILSMFCLLK